MCRAKLRAVGRRSEDDSCTLSGCGPRRREAGGRTVARRLLAPFFNVASMEGCC